VSQLDLADRFRTDILELESANLHFPSWVAIGPGFDGGLLACFVPSVALHLLISIAKKAAKSFPLHALACCSRPRCSVSAQFCKDSHQRSFGPLVQPIDRLENSDKAERLQLTASDSRTVPVSTGAGSCHLLLLNHA
jgi:hypothetical protein